LARVIIEVKRACVHLFPVADFHLDVQSPFGTSELWLNCCLQDVHSLSARESSCRELFHNPHLMEQPDRVDLAIDFEGLSEADF
jgi:hypothetical protein